MEALRQKFYEKYAVIQTRTIRNFYYKIDWTNRFIGIKGSRGVGKTTILLQYIKLNYKPDSTILYVSMDDMYFTENSLYKLADIFYKKGGVLLAIDEIHRYSNWSVEIKNIYDDFPGLKVFFTGSSLLHLQKAKADLSRRVVVYDMPGLSFREFISFTQNIDFSSFRLSDILQNHIEISSDILSKIRPLSYFEDYLRFGYYPYFLENIDSFHHKLNEVILTVLEVDIPQFETMQVSGIIYLKKLLRIISKSSPFKPNMISLSQRTGISLNTMKSYLKYLMDSKLLLLLYHENFGINSINKPEKIYLENTNLMFVLSDDKPDKGNLRETFLFNQLSNIHQVNASKFTDFLIDEKYAFEVGGRNKTKRQIKGIENAYLVKDDIEIGFDNTIPLYLFGFLY